MPEEVPTPKEVPTIEMQVPTPKEVPTIEMQVPTLKEVPTIEMLKEVLILLLKDLLAIEMLALKFLLKENLQLAATKNQCRKLAPKSRRRCSSLK